VNGLPRGVDAGRVRALAASLARAALVAAVYVASAKAAFALAFVHTSIAPVWPPSGVALAALLLLGRRAVPGVFLGAFVFNALTPVPLPVSVAIGAGNTLEAVAGAWLLGRAGFRPAIDRLRDVLALTGLAALGSTAISASIGIGSLWLGGTLPAASAGSSWTIWWLGDASGVLTVTPLLLLWSTRSSWPRLRLAAVAEAAALTATLALAVWAILTPRLGRTFLIFPVLVWTAVRFRLAGAAVASLAVSAAVAWATAHGYGPFSVWSLTTGLLVTQVFTIVITGTGLFLAALTVERERAVQTLRTSEERFRLLVDTVQDYAMYVLDPEGRVVSWNEGAARIKGYTAGEILGTSFARFYTPDDLAAGRPQATLAKAAADGRHQEEGWRVRKDGSLFWADVVVTAMHDERGEVRGFIKMTRDRTERRRAEEALRRSEEGFRRTSEVKSEFLALMSHELRTPLSTMLISAEMLENPAFGAVTEAKARDLGAKITTSGRHLLDLIDDLLDLSRIEAGQLDLVIVATPLGPLLDEIHRAVASTAAGPGVGLDIPTGVPGHVLADPLRLRQVLLNLLINAIKFTEPGGRVWLEVPPSADVDDDVVLLVRDTGIGIAAEQLEQIFVPFHKGSASAQGAGLGLAIAQRLVELQGGSLTVTSTVDEGTTFTLTLPRARPGPGPAEVRPAEPEAHLPSGRQVLVVEDDPMLQQVMALVLEDAGYAVDRAGTMNEAVDAITTHLPALVLLDLSLGNADGLDVLHRMRAEPSTSAIPVVALSGRVAEGDVERALAAGCEAHLAKPIGARELLDQVRHYLPPA
jgi:PAS domain S-box-containing protein